MKRNHLIVLGCALVLFFVSGVYTSAGTTEKKAEVSKELKNQTNCPVMGGKIDSTIFTDIQDQRVYHCCPMCRHPV